MSTDMQHKCLPWKMMVTVELMSCESGHMFLQVYRSELAPNTQQVDGVYKNSTIQDDDTPRVFCR